jgi:MucR family transcriptional regulator, transcriptional regulator of exopolysaccharide biosynthesis
MVQRIDAELAIKMTTEIAVAYLTRNPIERAEISALIRDIRAALTDDAIEAAVDAKVAAASAERVTPAQGGPGPSLVADPATASDGGLVLVELRPAVPVRDSVSDDYIVSLEDGKRFRSLRRHLMAKYGMTPDDYRRKWNLPADYPMVAPSYAQERSEVAKRTGLGRGPEIRAKTRNKGRKI